MIKDTLALERLAERLCTRPVPIDNSSLVAGSPMFFYCKICGHLADTKEENYLTLPAKYCSECLELKEANPGITDGTFVHLGLEQELLWGKKGTRYQVEWTNGAMRAWFTGDFTEHNVPGYMLRERLWAKSYTTKDAAERMAGRLTAAFGAAGAAGTFKVVPKDEEGIDPSGTQRSDT